jgi:hypothetical protein
LTNALEGCNFLKLIKKLKHMRKTFLAITIMTVLLASQSCNTQVSDAEEPAKIENTLQSVSYFQDTVGVDPTVLIKAFALMNEAIEEIGYPDAGYKLWIRESDTSDVRFMIEGLWPDQAAYELIHDNQLYIDASTRTANDTAMVGLVSVEYYRFEKIN